MTAIGNLKKRFSSFSLNVDDNIQTGSIGDTLPGRNLFTRYYLIMIYILQDGNKIMLNIRHDLTKCCEPVMYSGSTFGEKDVNDQ